MLGSPTRYRSFEFPPFPPILSAIGRALDDPMADDDEVRRAVRADEALTVGLIRYANSAWLARRRRAETINEALTIVGLAGVRSVVLTQFLGAFFTRAGPVDELL